MPLHFMDYKPKQIKYTIKLSTKFDLINFCISIFNYVSKILNVHVNEIKNNLLFTKKLFLSSEKLIFEKENVIF